MTILRQVFTVAIPALLLFAWLEYDYHKLNRRIDEAESHPSDPPEQPPEPPELPKNLNLDRLPKYYGGCPGCGFMSFVGEGIWRYRVLEKTRDRWDNTTTYLARCKKCHTLMKATVDHND